MEKRFEKLSKKITVWIGSTWSIIVHTIFFVAVFGLKFLNVSSSDILLILTTAVSLEAIYLAIFIQMTVNRHSEELQEVSEDIEEIQEDVEDIQEDVEDISEDVEELQEDVEELNEDYDADDDAQLSRFEYMEHTLRALLKEMQEMKQHRNVEIDAGHHIAEPIEEDTNKK